MHKHTHIYIYIYNISRVYLSVCVFVCVFDNHTLTVRPINANFCMHTHMIPRCVKGYNFLTSGSRIHKGPLRSKRSKYGQYDQKNKCFQGSICCIPILIIFPTNMWYDILTQIVIRGHWRSQEVKRRSNLKNAPRDPIFGIYAHIISLTNVVYGILISKVIRGHQRSLEGKRRSDLKYSPKRSGWVFFFKFRFSFTPLINR